MDAKTPQVLQALEHLGGVQNKYMTLCAVLAMIHLVKSDLVPPWPDRAVAHLVLRCTLTLVRLEPTKFSMLRIPERDQQSASSTGARLADWMRARCLRRVPQPIVEAVALDGRDTALDSGKSHLEPFKIPCFPVLSRWQTKRTDRQKIEPPRPRISRHCCPHSPSDTPRSLEFCCE